MKYTVYTTRTCPRCEQLKAELKKRGIQFEILDMATPEALTELRVNGVFTLSAPVLQAEDRFYTSEDLFNGDTIKDIEPILKAQ